MVNWNSYKNRLMSRNKVVYTYQKYTKTPGGYLVEPEVTRGEFEEYRRNNNKCYDRPGAIHLRPDVSNSSEGFLEITSRVTEEPQHLIEEELLLEFCKEYGITDRDTLMEFLDFSDNSLYEKLKALHELPQLLGKFQS